MYEWVRPNAVIPVHGEHRMLISHSKSAQLMGVPEDNILILENGDVVEVLNAYSKSC